MNIPFWLLKLLPMWEHICPKCRREVKANSHECPHCGEKYPLVIRVPPTFLKDPKKLEAYVHKHIFPRVSEFERNYLTKYFTVIFSSSFAEGNFSAWTGVVNSPTIDTTIVHHGSYSSYSNASNEYCYKSGFNLAEVYAREYVYLHSTGTGSEASILHFRAADWTIICSVEPNTDGKVRVSGIGIGEDISITNFPMDEWVCLEVHLIVGNGTGAFHIYLNGTEVADLAHTNLDNDSNGNFDLLCVGSRFVNNKDVYIDCVVVADAYIGPEASSTLQTVTDSLTLADALLRHKALMVSDNLGIADSTVGRDKSLLVTSDLVSLIDYFSTPSRVLQALDSIGLSDTALIQKVLVINETVSLAEVVESGVGGAKKTRLFLILGDLAIQLTDD